MHTPLPHTPPPHACPLRILREAVNERAVRILLECILVLLVHVNIIKQITIIWKQDIRILL